MSFDLRSLVHQALCLREPPYLKHYPRGEFRLWEGVALCRSSLPGPGFNYAACILPTPPFDQVFQAASSFFEDSPEGWGILVEADAGHPIEEAVRDRDWIIAEDEPAFALASLHDRPRVPTSAEFQLAIRTIETEADRKAFMEITSKAYGTPPDMANSFMPSLDFARDPHMHWVLGERGSVPVAAGGYLVMGSTAVVVCLATLEHDRGKGYGTLIMDSMLKSAIQHGCTNAALRSGPKSVPLYERMGFQFVCQHRTYSCPGYL